MLLPQGAPLYAHAVQAMPKDGRAVWYAIDTAQPGVYAYPALVGAHVTGALEALDDQTGDPIDWNTLRITYEPHPENPHLYRLTVMAATKEN